MGQGALNYQGTKGGLKLNDIIEEFNYIYKGQTIKAGDFVNYINGVGSSVSSISSEITVTTSRTAEQTIFAVKLTENKFVIFGSPDTGIGWAIVGTFENANIQLGTLVYTPDSVLLSYQPSATKISENSILLVGCTDTYDERYLCGVVATISGTTISFGSVTNISTTNTVSGRYTSCISCDDNKVFVTHEHGKSNPRTLGIVCTISGTTITAGTDISLTSGTWVVYCNLGLLEKNKIFVAADDNGGNRGIYGYICTIAGITITMGTQVSIGTSGDYYGHGASLAVFSPNKVVLSYGRGSTYYNLYGMVCTIDGTTITTGTNTLVSSTDYALQTSILKITEDKAFVSGLRYMIAGLYGMFYLIDDTTITGGTLTTLSTNSYSISHCNLWSLMLSDNNALVLWPQSDPYYPSMQLWKMDTVNNIPTNQITVNNYEQQVTLATEPPFDGIALSEGTGGTNTEHNEQVKIAKSPIVYNYKKMTAIIDLSNTDPATCVSYADDAVNMVAGSDEWDNFFGHYPVVLIAGEEAGKINRNNFKQLEDGSSITEGDVMIAFPRRGLTIKTGNNKIYISMTDNPNDSAFEYNAHTRGTDWRDKFYLGAYKASKLEGKLRSSPSTATPLVNETIGSCRNYAHANGTGYELSGFYQLIFRQCMYILKYKNLDSQTAVGRGYVDASSSTNTHGTDTLGMDYGTTSGTTQMKLFGIEDFWGNVYEWIDGIYCDANWHILTGNDDFNDTGSGYYDNGQCVTSNIYGNILTPQGSTKTGFIIKTTDSNSSYNTAFCDYGYLSAGQLASFGGDWTSGSYAGAFQLYVIRSASSSYSYIGARLMYL